MPQSRDNPHPRLSRNPLNLCAIVWKCPRVSGQPLARAEPDKIGASAGEKTMEEQIPLKHPVMLIEDDDRLAQLIAEYLGSYEFAVTIVRRGDIAVAAVREHKPALVILDL